MDKFDRFQLLHRKFRSHRKPIPLKILAENLECSPKTVQRTIDQMRDYLDAPIEYCSEQNGWYYAERDSDLYELPGLWLTGGELQSLALLLQLLEQFGKGLLNEELGVIENYIEKLLAVRGIERSAFDQHIKVIPLSSRYVGNKIFVQVGEALLHKQQIEISYKNYAGQTSKRTLSPQTLVYYRENWYLDAWCHLRADLRTFSLARIEKLAILQSTAKVVNACQLKQHFSQGYGIFAGQAQHTAKLRFAPQIAREIALQQWHPQQEGEWQGGEYLLSIPYSDARELVQDILRHTPNVKVEAPAVLKKAVKMKLQQGLENYLDKGMGWL